MLATCEGQLRDHQISGRLTFYIHIAKLALWRADEDWLDNVFSLLDQNHDQIPPYLEYDVEIVFRLRDYYSARDFFLDGNIVREAMDDVLRAYCLGSEAESDQRFLECQQLIANEPEETLRAFPLDFEDQGPIYIPWNWISHDVAERIGSPDHEVDNASLFKTIRRWMKHVDEQTMRSRSSWMWSVIGLWNLIATFAAVTVAGGGLTLAILLATNADSHAARHGTFLGVGLASAAVLVTVFKLGRSEKILQWMAIKISSRFYRRLWRTEAMSLLQLTHVPFEQVRDMVIQVVEEDESGERIVAFFMPQFLSYDYGLAIYAGAQRFVV